MERMVAIYRVSHVYIGGLLMRGAWQTQCRNLIIATELYTNASPTRSRQQRSTATTDTNIAQTDLTDTQ